jgi:CDGSH-type Zn-finger protein
MTEPKIAFKYPAAVEVEVNKTYAWCACGLSKKQPFCDGSHSTTEIRPLIWKADQTKTVHFCQCKHSKNKPFCDGVHKTL